MHLKSFIRSIGLLASAAWFLFGASSRADIPAFELGNISTDIPQSFTGTRGWSFYNGPNNPIAITHLGIFDSGGDGLVNSHEIGLWGTDGTLLASATVPAGTAATLDGGYRYVSISPVYLPGSFGTTGGYIIAAQYTAGDADDLLRPVPVPNGLAPGLAAWTGGFPSIGWYGLGPDLPFPSQRTQPAMEGSLGRAFWEPNFQFVAVPEPSTFLLLVCGALGLLVWRRKSS